MKVGGFRWKSIVVRRGIMFESGIFRIRTFIMGVILYLFGCALVPVFALPLEEIINNVQRTYRETEDLTADFIQESTLKSLNKTQTAAGKIYYKNRGKLRWDYKGTTEQEIVTDGETLWMYLPEDNQVIVNQLSKVYQSNTSAFFLSEMGDLKKDFNIQLVEATHGDNDKGYHLKLIPRELQSNFDELFLWVDKRNFLVVETYFYDFYGNLIRIKFQNHRVNNGLPDSMFVFKIPKDAEVIEVR